MMAPKNKEDRRLILIQDPAMFRRAILTLAGTLLVLMAFFGMDAIDSLLLEISGVSALSGIREFVNRSTSFKMFLLILWGWWIFDFALQGGIRLSTAPYGRLINQINNAPSDLSPFKTREDDQEFRMLVDAVNALFQRIQKNKENIRTELDLAFEKEFIDIRLYKKIQEHL